jgi:hypothetical protein
MHENLSMDLRLSTIGTHVDPVLTRTACLAVPRLVPLAKRRRHREHARKLSFKRQRIY